MSGQSRRFGPPRTLGSCIRLAVTGALIAAVGLVAPAAARPPATKLLPDSTAIFVTVADVPELVKRFQNTSLGQMSRDPKLRPLIERVYGSVGEALAQAQEEIGLSLSDVLAIPQGEVTLAFICPEDGQPELVVLLDAGEHIGSVRTLLGKLETALLKDRVTKQEETIEGTKLIVFGNIDGRPNRKLVFFEKDNAICMWSNLDSNRESKLEVVQGILTAWGGAKTDVPRLSENTRYAAIASRCGGTKELAPQILAFADPIRLAKSIGQEQTGVRVGLAMLPALGLDGFQAVGASITMDAGAYDTIMHAHVLLDSPRTGVLEVIAMEPGDFTPEPWVPADVAHYSTLHWNFKRSVAKIASLQDSFMGQGFFQRQVAEPFTRGTQIDFNKDLVDGLDGRASMIVWVEQPITLTSQHMLLGLRLKDPKAFGEKLDRAMAKYERMWKKQMYAGKPYWEMTIRRPDGQPLPSDGPQPHPCIGVLENYVMISNQPGVFHRVIVAANDPTKSLSGEPDFKLVAGKIGRLAGSTKPGWIGFDRPEEGFRFIYGLATADRTREALRREAESNPFFKSLNTILEENPLPPFAVLARYLAPGGTLIVDDETGLHYTAFSLRRKAQ